MAQLVRALEALYDVTTAYRVPCISGKDSMKNDSVRGGRKISIPPTVLFSAVGIIDDIASAVTLSFKQPGDPVYMVGVTKEELGASEFFRLLADRQRTPGATGGTVPTVEPSTALATYRAMNQATATGLLRSSHTPTLGGLAAALAFCSMAGDRGADIELKGLPVDAVLSDDARLFSESHSRFLVTCAPNREPELQKCFEACATARIGTVIEEPRLRVRGIRGRLLIDAPPATMRKAFKETLHGI